MYYLNCFFIYSILGFLFETIVALITKSGFKSGILIGCWTPIYGIGSVLILLLSHYFFMNLHLPRWVETIIVFFVLTIFLSCIELLSGIAIEKIFHVTFWDYTKNSLNIGKYISLGVSLIWGVASIIFIYIIHPLINKLIVKIPSYVPIILSVLFIADVIVTIVKGVKK